jgi:Uma2 family endonuclease
MSTAILEPRRKRFSRNEVDRMQDLGFFDCQRCDLIGGELIDKSGLSSAHAYTLRRVSCWLMEGLTVDRVRSQFPMECASTDREWNYPDPDIAVVAEHKEEFGSRHPRGDETVLVVEVADNNSIHMDRTTKRDLYARAGVLEYWILDTSSRRLIRHRNPLNGRYGETAALTESDSVACAARPDQSISVRELLP